LADTLRIALSLLSLGEPIAKPDLFEVMLFMPIVYEANALDTPRHFVAGHGIAFRDVTVPARNARKESLQAKLNRCISGDFLHRESLPVAWGLARCDLRRVVNLAG
jgi:hypothetical protein